MLTKDFATVEECCAYVGIIDPDESVSGRVDALRSFAASFVNESVGGHVDDSSPMARELALIVLEDAYGNRGVESQKVSASVRRLVQHTSQLLVLEGRQ